MSIHISPHGPRGVRAIKNITFGLAAATSLLIAAAPASAAPFVSSFDKITTGNVEFGYYYFVGHQASETYSTGLSSVNKLTLSLTADQNVLRTPLTFTFSLNGNVIGETTYTASGADLTKALNFSFDPITSASGAYTLLANVTTGVAPGAGSVHFSSTTQPLTLDSTAVAAAVPEPATWAMMLVGFGMVGAAARYRRRSTAATFA
ncbi:hypothetical protein F4693_002618 [Sphingomonas endophytica]|uniref:Ice-binding protein C-terminal domain-containing protein n=1 Tax=Sphingomonas endophytica TaxID=869719 RepID=A0A7X0MQL7_9SPHN|nr:PEPxxWA-CTERM sorting domain-containing protein [Sphingomonas endophytica]MBB6505623.1 hypothetical protein [Sphingomonas endophytica]